MKKVRDNILLIAGNGQNVGKTLFASRLIRNLSQEHSITAIKICPHFYKLNPCMEILVDNEKYQVAKENSYSGVKDSNRLLLAGAKEVYYVQAKDNELEKVLSFFDELITCNTPLIIESGGLRSVIKPGLFIMIDRKNNTELKYNTKNHLKIADLKIEFDGKSFNYAPEHIEFSNDKWQIKNKLI